MSETPQPPRLYLYGKPAEGAVEVYEHVSPVRDYVVVLVALFALTGLTYLVSFANLGPASLPVAMFVAFCKATLVCAYFMHLRYDNGYHVFVFVSTLLFVAIFFTITLFDLSRRAPLAVPGFAKRATAGAPAEAGAHAPEAAAPEANGHGDAPTGTPPVTPAH